jgi:hypothetical protein
VARGENGNEFFVGVGGASAELVIEVDNRKNDSEFFTKFKKEKKQSDRVGATRNGDSKALARRGPMAVLQVVSEPHSQVSTWMDLRMIRLGKLARGNFLGHGVLRVS